MKKIAKLNFLIIFLFVTSYVYSEDATNDSLNALSTERVEALSVVDNSTDNSTDTNEIVEKEEEIWKTFIKDNVAKNVLFSVSATEENISENENLWGFYHYDKNKMLDKMISDKEKIKVPHSVIHSNFVKLLQVGKKNIYVSPLFTINQKCFYFIAKHLSEGYVMFLFNLPLDFFPAENFILFNEKGEKLLNMGFPMIEVRKIENLLKNNLNNLDTLEEKIDNFSIIESNSPMYFYTK